MLFCFVLRKTVTNEYCQTCSTCWWCASQQFSMAFVLLLLLLFFSLPCLERKKKKPSQIFQNTIFSFDDKCNFWIALFAWARMKEWKKARWRKKNYKLKRKKKNDDDDVRFHFFCAMCISNALKFIHLYICILKHIHGQRNIFFSRFVYFFFFISFFSCKHQLRWLN